MTALPGKERQPNRRGRRLILLAAVAALLAAGGAWWRYAPRPLSAEERDLVGTWEVRLDGVPAATVLEYEFRADRTCRMRDCTPGSGTALAGLTWDLSGGRLAVRHPGAAAPRFWHVLPSQHSVDEVFRLAPDGPGRFRYAGAIETPAGPPQPPVTGTMTRVTPAG